MNVLRFAVPVMALAAASVLTVAPAQAKIVKTPICKSSFHGAIGRGLSGAKQKWSEKVAASEGVAWARIGNAADMDYRCQNNGKVNVCKLRARPCLLSSVLRPIGSE